MKEENNMIFDLFIIINIKQNNNLAIQRLYKFFTGLGSNGAEGKDSKDGKDSKN